MTPIDILRHAPVWVWPLLFALIALGLFQSRPRLRKPIAALAPALVLGGLSLAGLAQTFRGEPFAIAVWWIAAGGALLVTPLLGIWRGLQAGPGGKVLFPGSWLPMLLFVGLFVLRFATGAALALHPDLLRDVGFIAAVAAACGLASGVLVARGRIAWQLVH